MPSKILIVDDDVDLANLLAERLKEHEYDIVVAHDGFQAIKLAHSERPDIILLDILMPAGGGINTFKNLASSEHTVGIPVIFITAYDTEEIRQNVLNMGAKDFFAKPFKMEEILKKIENVVGGKEIPPGAG